jgi:predicted O-linked N-acetylglucosamine transferase (SPINDLY family)
MIAANNTDDPNERGISLARAGRIAEARDCFVDAIRRQPERASAHFNLGLALFRLNDLSEAERSFERSIRLEPTDADSHLQLGLLYRRLGRFAEAVVALRHAIRFGPDKVEGFKALGTLLFDLGQSAEAVTVLESASKLAPNEAELHNDLGNALRQLERIEKAAESYRNALAINPQLGPAHANLGNLLAERGDTTEARTAYTHAYRHQRLDRLRVLAETALPVIYDSVDQISAVREELTVSLDKLIATGIKIDPTSELFPTHFYLAYQGHNDRELHETFAKLADGPRSLQLPPPQVPNSNKVRIGFLSRYLRNHTIGQLNHGLIAHLPRDRFEVTVLLTGPGSDDAIGKTIAGQCDRFVRISALLPQALQQVRELGLDVLYWPDVGMDAQTYTMAFSRLAPVQVASWGHPVTTGLKTIDYFISSERLELPGSENQYSERLVRLPRLAVHYERPTNPQPARDRGYFGLPENTNLYLCPQTLFKLHPEIDSIFAGILRGDPAGRLVLIDGRFPQWKERIVARFKESMPDVMDRVIWVRKLHREEFLNLLALSDVMLDPINFGGGNTSYEGLALGVPIVTMPSNMLRGRLTYAMYQQMGMTDLMVTSPHQYVDLAVRLGMDRVFNRTMRTKILETAETLYGDDRAVAVFADWLWSVAKA